ncbi:MAG: cation:proton antiporter subunit C [Litorimonas sp.]
MDLLFTHFNYVVVIVLMMTGLYVVFASRNLIKKMVGLSVFQTSVFLFYITLGKVASGQPPILEYDPASKSGYDEHAAYIEPVQVAASGKAYALPGQGSEILYSNPLPHVLILTAIVVGVATLAIGLALSVRIREVYGTIELDALDEADRQYNLEGVDAPADGTKAA